MRHGTEGKCGWRTAGGLGVSRLNERDLPFLATLPRSRETSRGLAKPPAVLRNLPRSRETSRGLAKPPAVRRHSRGLATLALMVLFLALVVWAGSARRRPDFDEAAKLPLGDDREPPLQQEDTR